MSTAPHLLVEDAGYRVGARDLLQHVTLDLRPGVMVAISGPSGAGKTTLLSVAGGLARASAFAIVPAEVASVAAGGEVDVMLVG